MQSNESLKRRLIWFHELYYDARAVFKSNSINEFRIFPLFDNSIDVSRDRVQKPIWSIYYVSVDGAVSSRCEIKPFIHTEIYFLLFWRRRWRQWIPGVAFFCWAIDFIQTIELFKGLIMCIVKPLCHACISEICWWSMTFSSIKSLDCVSDPY